MGGVCKSIFIMDPAPRGQGEGSKGQISIKFNFMKHGHVAYQIEGNNKYYNILKKIALRSH